MPEMSYLEAMDSARTGPTWTIGDIEGTCHAARQRVWIDGVDEPPSAALLDVRRRPARHGRDHRQSRSQRLHDRKAELLFATRAGICAMGTDQPADATPDCGEQLPHLAVGPVTQQDEGGCQIRLRRLYRSDPGELGRFRQRWIIKIASNDDQGRPGSQR